MEKTVDGDTELMKVQILHEKSLQKAILRISSALTLFLTGISLILTILQMPQAILTLQQMLQVQRLNEVCQFIILVAYLSLLPLSIIILFYCTKRNMETTVRDYNQKLQKISDILEEVKKGRELPKLEEIGKEF